MKINTNNRHVTWLLALLFLALFAVGCAFPNVWWGVHYLGFLTPTQQLVVATIAAAILVFPKREIARIDDPNIKLFGKANLPIPLIGAAAYALIIYTSTVAIDPYGDAVYFQKFYHTISTGEHHPWQTIFAVSADAWAGQDTIIAVVRLISFHFQIDHLAAFKVLGLVTGTVFAFIWLRFLQKNVSHISSRVMFGFVGLSSPFVLIFFGRTEIYAIPILMTLVWSIAVVLYFHKGKKKTHLAWVMLATLLCIKSHPMALLMVPSTLVMVVFQLRKKSLGAFGKPKLSLFIFLPILTVGFILYFLVLKDHVDDRVIGGAKDAMQYDHLFLPLFSPNAPLNRYNIFSYNHIFDFVNMLLLSSPALLFILSSGVGGIKTMKANDKDAAFLLGITAALYYTLLFAVNPILSMPMDWDLYTIPVPIIMVMAVLPFRNITAVDLVKPALVICFLSSTFIITNQKTKAISKRLEAIGIHVYYSYYVWTSNILSRSLSISNFSYPAFEARTNAQINRLEQYPIDGPNYELARVHKEYGKWLLREKKDLESAELQFLIALKISPSSRNARMLLTESYFKRKQFAKAFNSARLQLEFENQPSEKTLMMIIHCALEAELYDEALHYSSILQSVYNNQISNEIINRITNNDKVEELKFLFDRMD